MYTKQDRSIFSAGRTRPRTIHHLFVLGLVAFGPTVAFAGPTDESDPSVQVGTVPPSESKVVADISASGPLDLALDGFSALGEIWSAMEKEKGAPSPDVAKVIKEAIKSRKLDYEAVTVEALKDKNSFPPKVQLDTAKIESILGSGKYKAAVVRYTSTIEDTKYKTNSWSPDPPLTMHFAYTFVVHTSNAAPKKFEFSVTHTQPSGVDGSDEREQRKAWKKTASAINEQRRKAFKDLSAYLKTVSW
jgi:hypothetical protein